MTDRDALVALADNVVREMWSVVPTEWDRACLREKIIDALRAAAAGSEPVAWRYRWKIDGEWTNWRVSDHSQMVSGLKDIEEYPLYTSPTASADATSAGWQPINPAPCTTRQVEKILHDHFYTGEPGQYDAIKAAAKLLTAVPPERRFLIDALDALEAIDSELVLTGHLKELADCALAARNATFLSAPPVSPSSAGSER